MMNFINTQIVQAQAALTVATDSLADRLTAREEGQAMVEYGLILVLVSVVAVVGLTAVGGQLYGGVATQTGASASDPVFNRVIHSLNPTWHP